jgi:hypothetical protein
VANLRLPEKVGTMDKIPILNHRQVSVGLACVAVKIVSYSVSGMCCAQNCKF